MITNNLFLERSQSPLKRCRIPFIFTKSDAPHVVFTMAVNRDIVAILDSGASTTLVSYTFCKDFPEAIVSSEPVEKVKMQGFGGIRELSDRIVISLPAKAEDGGTGKLEIKGFIDDLSYCSSDLIKDMGYPDTVSLIIGSDAFLEYGAQIDFKNQEVILYV